MIGLASGVTAIAAGANHSCALKAAGAVLCWGYNVLRATRRRNDNESVECRRPRAGSKPATVQSASDGDHRGKFPHLRA